MLSEFTSSQFKMTNFKLAKLTSSHFKKLNFFYNRNNVFVSNGLQSSLKADVNAIRPACAALH